MGWRRGSTVEGGGALHWLPPGPGPSPVPDVGRAGFATRAERVHPEDARGPPPLPVPCSSLCCPWGTLGTAVNPGVSLRLSRHSWRKGGVGGIFISSSLHLTCEGSQVCGPASPSLAVRLEGSQRHQSVCPPTGSPSRHVCLVWDLACKILHNKQTDCCCVISVKSAVTVRRASQIRPPAFSRQRRSGPCWREQAGKLAPTRGPGPRAAPTLEGPSHPLPVPAWPPWGTACFGAFGWSGCKPATACLTAQTRGPGSSSISYRVPGASRPEPPPQRPPLGSPSVAGCWIGEPLLPFSGTASPI